VRRGLLVGLLTVTALLGACGDDGDTGRGDDIVWLLPEYVPGGWTLHIATERVDPVPDYTVSWAPIALAGRDRAEAAAAPDTGPQLFINVGARAYAQYFEDDVAPDAASAAIERHGDLLRLDFTMSGIPVSVSGREVTENQLRRFAESLGRHDHADWRDDLGERLLVDRPS
jgi:hypothetical protein